MSKLVALSITAVVAGAFYAEAAGTVPTVGGYSKHDFTVGIVTQVEGGVFAVRGESAAAQALAVGEGVFVGDQLWIEPKSLARVTDTVGGRLTIAGPASIEFRQLGRITINRGAVKFKSAEGQVLHFQNALVAGSVSGEGAVWASHELVQVLGLAGDVKAWHPQLASAAVLVSPGHFTESSPRFKQLQPKRPTRADENKFHAFLSQFEKSAEDAGAADLVAEAEKASRAIASEPEVAPHANAPMKVERGSRVKNDVLESPSEESVERLKARMAGKDYDDDDEVPLAAPGPRLDAYGRVMRPKVGRAIANVGPGFEVVKKADNKAGSERFNASQDLLKKIYKKHR